MKEYVSTIIFTSMVGSISLSMLSNKDNSLKKHVSFVVGLIYAIVFISPIVSLAENANFLKDNVSNIFSEIIDNDKIDKTNQIIVDSSVENICNGIKEAIISKYGFKNEDVTVGVLVNDKNLQAITIEKIEITLYNNATWYDSDTIKSYVSELVGCSVEISKK